MTSAPALLTPVAHRRSPPRTGWSYPASTPRDQRLDLLRGYALAAMAINHFGLHQSYLHTYSGRSGFLVSAAEAFLFISGFTLGFITIGRTPEQSTTRLGARTWTVYLATIGISFGLGLVAMTSQLRLWGDLYPQDFGSVGAFIGQVLTMTTAFNGADILVTYVVYLTAAIGALRLMTNSRSGLVAAVVASVYGASQLLGPENLTIGLASFRSLAANTPLFFGGLLIGFHRQQIATLWNRIAIRRALDATVLVASVILGWVHVQGWPMFAWLGERIAGPYLSEPLGMREFEMPVLPMLVVFLYLRAAWIIADLLWVPLKRIAGWFLLPLGEASLFTFTMHLIAIPMMINLPWWSDDDLGRIQATIWVLVYLAVIFAAVKLRDQVLALLRQPGSTRAGIRRHGPVVVVALLLAGTTLVGTSPWGVASEWGQDDWEEVEQFDAFDFQENFDEN